MRCLRESKLIQKMCGMAVIKGTRIPVYFILELLANGWSIEEILEDYPQLKKRTYTKQSDMHL
ncbi:DUF433 domain-containing protein [Thermococcus sp.]